MPSSFSVEDQDDILMLFRIIMRKVIRGSYISYVITFGGPERPPFPLLYMNEDEIGDDTGHHQKVGGGER